MKILAKRKAVATIVATILMINIAVTMGAILFVWTSGVLTGFQSEVRTQYSLLEESRDEAIVIENVWFRNNGTKYVFVFVRNVGVRQAAVVAVYVNGTEVSTTPSLPRTVYVSGNLTLTIAFSWNFGGCYSITVATAKGNQAKGEWIV